MKDARHALLDFRVVRVVAFQRRPTFLELFQLVGCGITLLRLLLMMIVSLLVVLLLFLVRL